MDMLFWLLSVCPSPAMFPYITRSYNNGYYWGSYLQSQLLKRNIYSNLFHDMYLFLNLGSFILQFSRNCLLKIVLLELVPYYPRYILHSKFQFNEEVYCGGQIHFFKRLSLEMGLLHVQFLTFSDKIPGHGA